MTLLLFSHPFSSYSQKVLVALYENQTPFTLRMLDAGHPDNGAELVRHWPTAPRPRRSSTPTGCTPSVKGSPLCGSTALACSPVLRSPAPSTRPGPTDPCSPRALPTATSSERELPRIA